MGSLRDQLEQKIIKKEPGHVWLAPNTRVRMDEDTRKRQHKPRFVLIVNSVSFLRNNSYHSVNIIPLSASVTKTDLLTYPIPKHHYTSWTFEKKYQKTSHALIYLYQPMKIEVLETYCGKISMDCYLDIQRLLIEDVIGGRFNESPFDLEL